MMMNEFLYITAALATGILIGSLFFGGLWLTVVKSMGSKTPAIWFMVSYLFRTAIVLSGFYYIGAGDIKRLLACLLGFIIARVLVNRLLANNNVDTIKVKMENHHEA